ncbi:outer membrane protein assembly factor BamC, partial [Trinickia sp.]|uniref:outer membrane protein assembly factor BamC n=1 Tax=Trinickia sp. TaxID=2571163 RepID=UPI003F8134B7
MTDFRFTSRFAALVLAGGLVAGCSTSSPTKVDYKSDSKSKQASLAVPPNLLDEAADQRSLPPQSGQASLSGLTQVQKAAPPENAVMPPVKGMHIQRDGTESWLVIDSRSPDQVWPQIRRFWQEQGFLLVVDQRDKHVLETDWNETRPQINEGLIRNTLSKAMGNSYVAAERNKFRTRLESAPNGGTYVFISQKGMREALTGVNNDSSSWEPKPNDPALELEYLKRLMSGLALADARGDSASIAAADIAPDAASSTAATKPGKGNADEAAIAARNAAMSAQAAAPARQPTN